MKHIQESIIGRRGSSYLKYDLTNESSYQFGSTVYRIRALRSIPSQKVKRGDHGGWIESYDNLDQKGDCWVADDACVLNNAKVYGDAKVYDDAKVFDNTEVYGNAQIYGCAELIENAKVYGDAKVFDYAQVSGDAEVCGNAEVYGSASVDYDINSGKITK